MNNDLNKKMLRTRQYWFDDGLTELLVGGLVLGLAGLYWMQVVVDRGWTAIVTALAMPLIILLGAFGLGRVLTWLKERIVYPRTGYVSYGRSSSQQRRRSGVIGGIIGFVMALMITQLDLAQWTTVLIGIGMGLFLFVIGMRLALTRFQLLALWSVAVGIVAALVQLTTVAANALTLTLIGGGLMLSGAVVLARYLVRTEPPGDDSMEVA